MGASSTTHCIGVVELLLDEVVGDRS